MQRGGGEGDAVVDNYLVDRRVADLAEGDLLDLESDPYADPAADDVDWLYEYGCVMATERETPDCVRVDFTNGESVGFPPDHTVKVAQFTE